MAVSKRSLSLGREHAGQSVQSAAARSRHSPVAQWRVEHGFPESPDPDHTCQGRCAFINIVDNIYLCENCGQEHICDENCKSACWIPPMACLSVPSAGCALISWMQAGRYAVSQMHVYTSFKPHECGCPHAKTQCADYMLLHCLLIL